MMDIWIGRHSFFFSSIFVERTSGHFIDIRTIGYNDEKVPSKNKCLKEFVDYH
jgi:hypothetical protein